jgi:predicted kinase
VTSRPLAVFVGGPPASGKTTLARALAPVLGAALLDLDVATGPLTRLVLDLIGASDLSEPRAAELTRRPRYDTLLDLATDIAHYGSSTVVVAPFGAERERARWATISDRLAPFADARLVWLTLSPAELAARLVARGAARDPVKLRDPAAYVAGLDLARPTAPHLALPATRPTDELVAAVVAAVRGTRSR